MADHKVHSKEEIWGVLEYALDDHGRYEGLLIDIHSCSICCGRYEAQDGA